MEIVQNMNLKNYNIKEKKMELNEKFLDLVKKNVPKDTTFFGIFLKTY